jgi:hypothetical protein
VTQKLVCVLTVHMQIMERRPAGGVITTDMRHRITHVIDLVVVAVRILDALVANRHGRVGTHHVHKASIQGDRLTDDMGSIGEFGIAATFTLGTTDPLTP